MTFGLCNAPTTFSKCMTTILSDFLGDNLKVFMDDFSVCGDHFDRCLAHLKKFLKEKILSEYIYIYIHSTTKVTRFILFNDATPLPLPADSPSFFFFVLFLFRKYFFHHDKKLFCQINSFLIVYRIASFIVRTNAAAARLQLRFCPKPISEILNKKNHHKNYF